MRSAKDLSLNISLKEDGNHKENTSETYPVEVEVKKPKLCCSVRLLVAIMCFFALFNISYARVGISMAFVCMVKPQGSSNKTERSDGKTGEFEWSSSLMGYLMSAVFYGFILGPFIGGVLSFKYGGKVVMVVGIIGAGATYFLVPELTRVSIYLFFVVRIFTGFFGGIAIPAFFDLMSHWVVTEESQHLINGALVGVPMASVLNFPITSSICYSFGWVWLFYVTGIWMVLWGFTFCFTLYDSPRKCTFISQAEARFLEKRIIYRGQHKIPWKAILKSLPIYAYIVIHFSMNYVLINIILSLPLLMERVYHFSLKHNALLSATPFIGSLVMRILLSLFFESLRIKLKLSKNIMRKILVFLGAFIFSSSLLTVTFLSPLYRYWVLVCFIFATTSLELCLSGGYISSVMDLCPSYANVITGIANTIGNTAGLITPVLTGCLTSAGTKEEWNIVFYINISVFVASATFYLLFGQNRLQYWGLASVPNQTTIHRSSLY